MDKTTEELLEELKAVAISGIRMTENGVEFLNYNGDVIFTLPIAGKED